MVLKREREWVGLMVSRVFDVYDNLEEELDEFIRNIKLRGRGVLLTATPGIDCRTLAFLLKYHADDLEFQVYMEENSIDEFEENLMAEVDKEMQDAEEAKYLVDQMKRLEKERPEVLKFGQSNENAHECGRYASVIADCDAAFAICAEKGQSPVIEQTLEFANQNNIPVNIHRPRKIAA
jgi:hypothetical protein